MLFRSEETAPGAPGAPKPEGDKPVFDAARKQADMTAAITQQQKGQLEVLKQQDRLALEGIQHQRDVLSLSAAEKAASDAYYNSINKSESEALNLSNQIAAKQTEINQLRIAGKDVGTQEAEVKGLKDRLKYVTDIKVQQAEGLSNAARQLELDKQGVELLKFKYNLNNKVYDESYKLERERADLTEIGRAHV